MKRLVLCAVLGAVPMLFTSVPAVAQEGFEGDWKTNMGAMVMEQDGPQVRGEYEMKDGRIHGELDEGGLSGIWSQSTSSHRCFEERMGGYYWGRFRLRLSDDERYFHGRWSYCNNDPGTGGEWTGRRVHRRD